MQLSNIFSKELAVSKALDADLLLDRIHGVRENSLKIY